MEIAQYIQEGKAVLGIEFGSTRIKAVRGHTMRRISGMVWQTVIVPWQNRCSKNIR